MAEVPEVDSNVSGISLKDILEAWDLTEYYPAFEVAGVDLSLLEEVIKPEWRDTLKIIIPTPGHLMKFTAGVRNLFGSTVQVQESSEAPTSSKAATSLINQDANNNLTSLLSTESTPVNTDQPSREDNAALTPHVSVQTEIATGNILPSMKAADNSSSANGSVSKKSSTTSGDRRERSVSTSPPEKRTCIDNSASLLAEVEVIRSVLRKSGSGRYLLALSSRGSALNDSEQNKLAQLIIDHEIVQRDSYKISASEFENIVKVILNLFPKESADTYYIPYRRISKEKKCLAKGKLVCQYYGQRKHLKAVGIITNTQPNGDSDDDGEEDVHLLIEGLEEKLNFLKSSDEPWERVIEYWKDTSKLRVRQLQRETDKVNKSKVKAKAKNAEEDPSNTEDIPSNVSAYLALYPGIRTNLGYVLLEMDFDLMYPEHKLKIYSELDTFIRKATRALEAIEKKPTPLQDNLQLLNDEHLTREAQILLVLESLCYLDTVVTVSRKKQKVDKEDKIKTWRPPHVEMQEGLISRVETVGRMESFIDARYKKFALWGHPVQPFCVVVTDDLDETETCYTIVGRRTWYLTHSPVRALDVCFKILHATHAQYSVESHRLWMLVQRKLYHLDTKFDDKIRDSQLIKLLQKFEE